MKNKQVILALLEYPLDCDVYVGKGMGPVGSVEEKITDRVTLIINPEGSKP